jgi:hypothetical protein
VQTRGDTGTGRKYSPRKCLQVLTSLAFPPSLLMPAPMSQPGSEAAATAQAPARPCRDTL